MKSASSRRINGDRIKYTAVKSGEGMVNLSEESPLLENVEKLSISAVVQSEQTSDPRVITQPGAPSCEEKDKSGKSEADEHTTAKNAQGTESKTKPIDAENETPENKITDVNEYQGARPKHQRSIISTTGTSGESADASVDNSIDIVRKMSQPKSTNYVPWRMIGPYQKLKLKSCHRLHAATGRADDLALFFHNGRFHVMEAWCTHMGGPLFEGDIEDYNGKCHVMCPWHSYMFDLETGKNEIGLQQKVYELKFEDGQIYVRYHSELTTHPVRKPSEPSGPRVINRPPEGAHEKLRKQSVLDTPLKLA